METTTGPLGQGLGASVGMAIAERMLAARFGPELVNHRTYVVAGDGCLMEGISHEAIDLAGHLRLGRVIVLWDDNRISIDRAHVALELHRSGQAVFAASGWHVQAIDGHDPTAIARALQESQGRSPPLDDRLPHHLIGFGYHPTKAGTEAPAARRWVPPRWRRRA